MLEHIAAATTTLTVYAYLILMARSNTSGLFQNCTNYSFWL